MMLLRGSLLILALFLSSEPVEATHFRGGIITWRPLSQPGANQTDYIPQIEISYRVAWRRSRYSCNADDIATGRVLPGEGSFGCSCSGLSRRLSFICTDFSATEDWTTGVNSGRYQPNIQTFQIWFTGGDWIPLNNGGGTWYLLTTVNLTARSDIGRINSSPTTTTLPIVRFQRSCNNTIEIPVSDADGDDVRCFWASPRCGGICTPLPGAFLYEAYYWFYLEILIASEVRDCILKWDVGESASTGLYGVALEIMDFATENSTVPLSRIPLQFLVDLSSSDESCASKPVFIPPTRVPGSCIGVPASSTYHEPIVMRTGSPMLSISNLETVSPPGFLYSSVMPYPRGMETDYYVNATWTPTTTGVQELLCFTAQDSGGSVSQQTCVTLVTGTTPPQIIPSSLDPASGSMVFPQDLSVQLQFDQNIVRPIRPTFISVVDDANAVVYQLDVQSHQVSFFPNNIVEFTIPGNGLDEKASYSIILDPGVGRSSTFCGVESPSVTGDSWTFTVRDITPPQLVFINRPSRTNGTAIVRWTVDEPADVTCTLVSPSGTNIVTCSDYWQGNSLPEGFYTLYVTATDPSGNVAPDVRTTWFVDLTPPTVEIYSGPAGVTNQTNANFFFRCFESCRFWCGYSTIDLTPFLSECTIPHPIQNLVNNGEYMFSVLAEDDVGNRGDEESFSWIVDTEPPSISNLTTVRITCGMPFDPSVTGNPVVTDNQDLTIQVSYEDESRSDCSFSRLWKATDNAGNTATTRQTLVIDTPLGPQLNIPKTRVLACSNDIDKELDIMNPADVPLVTHPCGRPLEISFVDDVDVKRCGIQFLRTWTVQDDCGNSASAQQIIQILELVFPESPANGEANVALRAPLAWPSYPDAAVYRLFIWPYDDMRPSTPTVETSIREFTPTTPYPPSTQMLWQIEYVVESGNNITRIPSPTWGFITRSFPDLTVTDIFLPDFAFSGQDIEVSWEVQNIGQMGISPVAWNDAVYFSESPQSTDMVWMTSERIWRFVDPGDGYLQASSWTLPEDLSGTYYVFVGTDTGRIVDDFDRSNNLLRAAGTLEVRLTPPPDLQVTSVVVPTSTFSGLDIDVRWSVDNLGLGITPENIWYDRIYFSADPILDVRDQLLITLQHDGILVVGVGYSSLATVTIPKEIFGNFYIIVETDALSSVYEHGFESNNEQNSSAISVVLSPPPDLQVTDVTVSPNPARSGDTVTVSWETTNAGAGILESGFWYDVIVLSQHGQSIRTLTWTYVSEVLSPTSSYRRQTTFNVNDRWASGDYQIDVTTDSNNRIFEFNSEDNNVLSSNLKIEQYLPDLEITGLDAVIATDILTGRSGVVLSWTVTNVGGGDTTRGAITDSANLRKCPTAACSSWVIGSIVTASFLRSGEGYNVSRAEFDIPSGVTGSAQIRVTTDASNRHVEGGNGGNVIDIGLEIPCLSPRLVVSDVGTATEDGKSADTVTAGSYLKFSWNVTNLGGISSAATTAKAVIRAVRLGKPTILSEVPLNSALQPGNSSLASISLLIPIGLSGNVLFHITYQINTLLCVPAETYMHGPILIQSPPTPNLHVDSVTWVPLVIGQSIIVNWTVTNIGNTMTADSDWNDQISLSSKSTGQFEILGTFQYTGLLEAGQSYTASKILLIPDSIGGSSFVSVTSSFELAPDHPESTGISESTSDTPLTLPDTDFPDLTVQGISGLPINASLGSSITIRYEVFNYGSSTIVSSWTDSVQLVQPFLVSDVGLITHTGILERNDKYAVSYTFTLPFAHDGVGQIQVTTDVTSQTGDLGGTNNVGLSENFKLYRGPMVDLYPEMEAINVDLSSGAPFRLLYNITNLGEADVDATWVDAIYLSQDAIIDPFDVRLASESTEGRISVGGATHNSIELSLPFDLPTAIFYVIIDVDSRGEIFEQNEDNNVALQTVEIRGGVSSDLAVTSVSSSDTVSYGSTINVDWSVQNLGLEMVEGYRCDTVYLSKDQRWNIRDSEVGSECQSFSLSDVHDSTGNTKMISLNAPIPLVSSGDHYAIVRSRSNVLDLNLENNIGIADEEVSVIIPLIKIDSTVTAQLGLHESLAYRIPSVPGDETMVLELTSDAEYDVNSLYVRRGDVASANQFDTSNQGELSPNQTITLTPTRSGDYYVLLQNRGTLLQSISETPSRITMTAKIAQFEVLDVSPRSAAPLGLVTLKVDGTVFPEIIEAKLICEPSDIYIYPEETFRFSTQQLYGTFDVSGVEIGSSCDLTLNGEAHFPNALVIISGVEGRATVTVSSPSLLRPFETGNVVVNLRNNGNTDILAPLLTFTVTSSGEARLLESGSTGTWAPSHVFVGASDSGPAGIIPPGGYAKFDFEVRNFNRFGTGVIEISVSTIPANSENNTNFYEMNRDFYRPFMFEDSRWTRLWDIFLEVVGPTQGSFVKHTSTLLNQLSLIEQRPRRIERIVGHQLNLIDGLGDLTRPSLDTVDIVDLPDARGTLTMEFGRSFDSRLSFRGVKGAFGRGWSSTWWNIKLLSVEDQTMIIEQDNTYLEFIKDESDGSFYRPGGFVTLNGTDYLYVDALTSSLRINAFDRDTLALRYIASLQDDAQLNFECNTDNNPVSVTSFFGSSLSISYTSTGLVEYVEAMDRQGITYQTASYEYDISGTYLTAVTVGDDTIQYTYESDGAVASVRNERGVVTMYHYSTYGSLERVEVLAQDDTVYSDTSITNYFDGRVRYTDQPANVTTDYIYSLTGEAGLVRIHGETTVKFIVDHQGGSSKTLIGDHVASREVYDSGTNTHYHYDGNDDVITIQKTLHAPFDEFIDSNGNVYEVEYDEDLRVRSTSYPDGSIRRQTSNRDGYVVEQESRDGSISTIIRNEENLIVQRLDESEDEIYFMYDENGRLTHATNGVGTISMTYNSRGNPRTVRYPDGKELIYDYDEDGRQTGIRDGDGYQVAYEYDSFGRVVIVTEGEDEDDLATIDYNERGPIARVNFANGCHTSYSYGSGGIKLSQIINTCDSVTSQFDYEYNERNLQKGISTTEGKWNVTYDGADQITAWVDPDGNEVSITYDSAGNRKEVERNGDVTSYAVNNLNQYIRVGNTDVVNDERGNIQETRNSTLTAEYEYNIVNQLIRSNIDGDECQYRYNALGILHDKECSGVRTTYYMDFFGEFGATLLMQSSGGNSSYYYHGPGIGLLANKNGGARQFYFFDGAGSVVGIVDHNGDMAGSFAYDPFGNILSEHGDTESPFQFSGKYGVIAMRETGLYFMRTRMYNPTLGRFISPDGLEFTGSPRNLYVYANNNPLLYTDPGGTIPFLIPVVWALAQGAVGTGVYIATQELTCKEVTWTGAILAGVTSALPLGKFAGEFGKFAAPYLSKAISKIPIKAAYRNALGKLRSAGNYIGSWVRKIGTSKGRGEFYENVGNTVTGDIVTAAIDDQQDFDAAATAKKALQNYAIDIAYPNKVEALAMKSANQIVQSSKTVSDDCRDNRHENASDRGFEDVYRGPIAWVVSIDPNDILGPRGYGDARYVAVDSTLQYRIRFENDGNATAPAQLVFITTELDDNVNAATFQLGEFGFGNYTYEVNSGSPILQTTIQFDDDRSYVVRVVAGLDFINRKATWRLQTLDPETGLPPADPGVGFLPPNPENGTDGEGFVTYSVRPLQTAQTYDVINAEARIVFDKNDPIDTEPTFNTVDGDPPVTLNISVIEDVFGSGILAVSPQTSDAGAGARSIDIYSDSDGTLTLLSSGAGTQRTFVLDLPPGDTYNIVALPEDHVGNFLSSDSGYRLEVFYPLVKASCRGVNNCSGEGVCVADNLCRCSQDRYGNDCSQEEPPKEPPIIGVAFGPALEDTELTLHMTARVLGSSANDSVVIRLLDVLEKFTSNIGDEEDNDLIVTIEGSTTMVLLPLQDFAGNYTMTVNATVADDDGAALSRVAEFPVFITPVADVPSVLLEETFYNVSDMNCSSGLEVDIFSDDIDGSEWVSLFISAPWGEFSFVNATDNSTHISWEISFYGPILTMVDVNVTVTSVEISTGDETSLDLVLTLPVCTSDVTTVLPTTDLPSESVTTVLPTTDLPSESVTTVLQTTESPPTTGSPTTSGDCEDVWIESSSAGELHFPGVAIGDVSNSVEMCPDYSSNADIPRATRYCLAGADEIPGWGDIVFTNCFEGMETNEALDTIVEHLEDNPVTSENVTSISNDVADATSTDTIGEDELVQIATVLESIVSVGSSSPEVTRNVIHIVNNLLDTDIDGSDDASAELLQSLETQLTHLHSGEDDVDFTEVGQSMVVVAKSFNLTDFEKPIVFGSFFSSDARDMEEDLTEETTLILEEGEEESKDVKAKITLPSTLLESKNYVANDTVPVTFIVHRTSELFHTTRSQEEEGPTVDSLVISATVEGEVLRDLKEPVVTHFNLLSEGSQTQRATRCVFWDFSLSDGRGDWSSEGCNLVPGSETGNNNGVVECHCNHMTNFAVLLDVQSSEEEIRKFDGLDIIGCSLTITSLVVTTIAYLLVSKLRIRRSTHVLVNLYIAILGLGLFFLFGIFRTDWPELCRYSGAFIHLFCLASATWMTAGAVHLYFPDVKWFMTKAMIAAWGLPLAVVVPSLAVNPGSYVGEYCFPEVSTAAFYTAVCALPAVLILCIYLLVLILVAYQMPKGPHKNYGRRLQTTKFFTTALLLALLMVLGWLLVVRDTDTIFGILFFASNVLFAVSVVLFFCVDCYWNSEASKTKRAGKATPPSRSVSMDGSESHEMAAVWS